MESTPSELLAGNDTYTKQFHFGELSPIPSKNLVVITCMDARIRAFSMLGIQEGDAHILRNAGGVITQDVLRSLASSQRIFGTTDVAIVQHTDCRGVLVPESLSSVDELDTLPTSIDDAATGDPETSVREAVQRVLDSPLVVNKDGVKGYIYDVHSGNLRLVVG